MLDVAHLRIIEPWLISCSAAAERMTYDDGRKEPAFFTRHFRSDLRRLTGAGPDIKGGAVRTPAHGTLFLRTHPQKDHGPTSPAEAPDSS